MLSSWFRGSRPNVVLRGSALDEDGLVVLLCRWLVQTRPSLPELQADDGSCFNPYGDEENLFKVSGGIEQTVELHRHELSKGGRVHPCRRSPNAFSVRTARKRKLSTTRPGVPKLQEGNPPEISRGDAEESYSLVRKNNSALVEVIQVVEHEGFVRWTPSPQPW